MMEEWRDIPGYGGKYQASREGQIRRVYDSGKTRYMTQYSKKMTGSKRLVVKLTKSGTSKEVIAMQVIAAAFLGPCPDGCVLHHINGCQSENHVNNLEYITKEKLGKLTGARSGQKSVIKIDKMKQTVDVYRSAREAGRQNYMSYQTVLDRCNGNVKKAFAPDGYEYAWEDSKGSVSDALRRIEKAERKQGGITWIN